jgi:exonuclease SbcC
MIDRLRIENFQRHELLSFSLHPRVTTIVGPTDSGKSAVVRALRWLATNRPRGTAMVRDGSNGAQVKTLIDGKTIARRRGKGVNVYRIDKHDYKAFGDAVPEDVERLWNVDESVNFQGQHDSPFWFSLTAGEVAKRLNSVVDLEAIDRVLSDVASCVRAARSAIDISTSRVQSVENELESLDFVDELNIDLARLRSLDDELDVLNETSDGLESAIAEIDELRAVAERPVPDLDGLREQKENSESLDLDVASLRLLINKVEDAQARFDMYRREVVDAEAELKEEQKGNCPLCGNPFQKENEDVSA